MRRASFWFTATTVETVPTATHNTTLSPASRALERGRSVREYPTHVPDPLSSFAHAAWRFLKVAPVGRYAAHDLSDGIGADSCPCAFHWLQYLLGQPRLSESFSRGASRGASNGRTSGQLFLAAPRAQLPTQRALDSPVYGLSIAPSRGSWARDGAQAEHRTCHWHGLAPVAAALPSAYRPLQAMATVFTIPSLSRYSRYN